MLLSLKHYIKIYDNDRCIFVSEETIIFVYFFGKIFKDLFSLS